MLNLLYSTLLFLRLSQFKQIIRDEFETQLNFLRISVDRVV